MVDGEGRVAKKMKSYYSGIVWNIATINLRRKFKLVCTSTDCA